MVARVLVLCLLGTLLPAGAALAQAPRRSPPGANAAAARVAFEEGSEHYEHGRYVEAMEAFERAYAATPSPELLYNIYTAAQRAGSLTHAERALSGYLDSIVVPEDERPALEARLIRLREEIAAEEARVAAEEQAAREAAAADAEEAERLAAAERRAREAEEEAARNAPAVSPAATVAFVIGGVGAVGFATFAGLAAREDRRVGRSCGAEVGSFCTDADVRQLRAYSLSADVSLGLGAAGAATGLVIYFVQRARRPADDEAAPDEASWHVAPVLGGPGGAWGVSAGGTF